MTVFVYVDTSKQVGDLPRRGTQLFAAEGRSRARKMPSSARRPTANYEVMPPGQTCPGADRPYLSAIWHSRRSCRRISGGTR
jgi:hypothetical protein